MCETTSTQSPSLLFHDECMLREMVEHGRRRERLQGALISKAKKYWSRIYGINKPSVLQDVNDFNLTAALIHDPKHLLFEGVTPMEMRLFLNHAIYSNDYFDLSYFNSSLQATNERIPAECQLNTVLVHQVKKGEKFMHTAHQMWWLSHLLHYLIGTKIARNDEKWLNFIRLLQIQQLCTSPVTSMSTVQSLTIFVAQHNKSFQELYPDSSYILKLYYLLV
jgi:hypothetical protein